MNSTEATSKMQPNQDYKFVATLIPPMLVLARNTSHLRLAVQFSLVRFDETNSADPFQVIDSANFRAGTAQMLNGILVLRGKSTSFPSSKPNTEEFETILKGDMTIE